jgi:hypothetical protein
VESSQAAVTPFDWWPLAALTVLAAALRLSTLDLQSFWYDEAFTPVHVLHASLGATLHAFVHTENNPPLWYLVVWAWSRLAGTGEVVLRLPSALAGIATVLVAWGIGRELAGRRAAALAGVIVAVNPLLVWYSQEARPYAFYVLFVALALLCMLRAEEDPTPRRLALFALSGALALLSHYFAVFLVVPMALWLARPRRGAVGPGGGGSFGVPFAAARARAREGGSGGEGDSGAGGGGFFGVPFAAARVRPRAQPRMGPENKDDGMAAETPAAATDAGNEAPPPARAKARAHSHTHTHARMAPRRNTVAPLATVVLVGAALVPLALAQGGHGTQWIGQWPLAARLEAIPQYYLTGYTGSSLGHGIELLVALLMLAGVGYGLWRVLTPRESDGALLALGIAACGVLAPMGLALAGADYLAPRNVVAAMVPLSAGIAVIVVARRTGRVGIALGGLIALAFLALTIDVDLSPRLQRGDWRGVAGVLRREWGAQLAATQAAGRESRLGRPGPQGAGSSLLGSSGLVSARPASMPPLTAITTVELGAAPLEYYLPPLHNATRDSLLRLREIDETGYAPLRPGAGEPPASGFRLVGRADVNGLIVYRFRSLVPRAVPEAVLREHVITDAHPEVLVPGAGGVSTGAP